MLPLATEAPSGLAALPSPLQAAATALKREPVVNAVIDGDDVIYRDYIDISIAVGTPKVRHCPGCMPGVDYMLG